jgi:glycosylphosphatidylinositol deacylase
VGHCTDAAAVPCDTLAPASPKLLASIPGRPFPVPDEGSGRENEGIVFFDTEVPQGAESWVGVTVDAGDDGIGSYHIVK